MIIYNNIMCSPSPIQYFIDQTIVLVPTAAFVLFLFQIMVLDLDSRIS